MIILQKRDQQHLQFQIQNFYVLVTNFINSIKFKPPLKLGIK